MSTAILNLVIQNDDGTIDAVHAVKMEGEGMRATIVGNGQKLNTRLSFILELLSTKQYNGDNTSS